MHPDVFSIGPFVVHSYGMMMALGFLAALAVLVRLGRRQGILSPVCMDLVFWGMLSGVAGARLAYVLEHWPDYAARPFDILRVDQGGLIFYGGFVTAAAAIVILARSRRLPLLTLLDLSACVVPLAHAFGRVGCFLNGCCFGAPTDAAIGVRFPAGSIPWQGHVHEALIPAAAPSSLPVHPVQLYETGYNLAVFAVLMLMYRHRPRPGMITALYLVLYAAGRFSLEFVRGDRGERLAVAGLSIGQFVSILVLITGVLILAVLRASRAGSGHSGETRNDGGR